MNKNGYKYTFFYNCHHIRVKNWSKGTDSVCLQPPSLCRQREMFWPKELNRGRARERAEWAESRCWRVFLSVCLQGMNRPGKDSQVRRDGVRRKDWHDYEAIRRDQSRSGRSADPPPCSSGLILENYLTTFFSLFGSLCKSVHFPPVVVCCGGRWRRRQVFF